MLSSAKNSPISPPDLEARRQVLGSAVQFDIVSDHSSMLEMLPELDIIIIAATLNNTTRGLVNVEFCKNVKDGAIVVNIARGQIVENESILSSLENGKIGFFASDVGCTIHASEQGLFSQSEPFPPTDPLAQHPNTLFTPHNGGIADVSYHNMAKIVAKTLLEVRSKKIPSVAVNGPFSGFDS
mmetsp:Transcript_12217/g.15836  ORF Transcript_12217/g.15836 Transcript_12217/m.15836 type:complete len:183 (+) Transcript_12217:11-559(+)